jgi:subtilisin
MFELQRFELKSSAKGAPKGEILDWGLKAVNAQEAWSVSKGEHVKVAVLDSGAAAHDDLVIKKQMDFTGANTKTADGIGHGTHVCGIIGARSNGRGMVGIAPLCDLYAAKIISDRKKANFPAFLLAMKWAMKEKVDIINMSFGQQAEPPGFVKEVIEEAYRQNIVMIAASGNEGKSVSWPAKYEEVIAVSAMSEQKTKAKFSNYGTENEIIAPGVEVYSTHLNGRYAKMSGTSMACALVTGAAALYISKEKKNGRRPSAKEVYEKLIASAQDLGEEGKDIHFGYGMIDAGKLVK